MDFSKDLFIRIIRLMKSISFRDSRLNNHVIKPRAVLISLMICKSSFCRFIYFSGEGFFGGGFGWLVWFTLLSKLYKIQRLILAGLYSEITLQHPGFAELLNGRDDLKPLRKMKHMHFNVRGTEHIESEIM